MNADPAPRRWERVARWLPGVATIVTYRTSYLSKDVVAGLVLVTLLVPQGMAYAQLAGLPTSTGLYTSIFCLIGYFLFGPSRVLVLGPDSALGPMIAAAVLPLAAAGDSGQAVVLASMLALMVGVLMTGAGLARLGFVADLLAKPTRIGYLNGLALTILVGRLPDLFGVEVGGDGIVAQLVGTAKAVLAGDAVPAAAAFGVVGLLVILVLQRRMSRIPAILIVVAVATFLAWIFDLGDHGVELVGPLPRGFPPLVLPHASWSQFGALAGGALAITLVALTDTISTSSAFAARSGQDVRADQEMIGIGAANIAASMFQGFPVSTSGSRTAVAQQSGSVSQVTGLVGAAGIAVLLLAVPGLLSTLPQSILAAVVMAAALSLADFAGARRVWRQRRPEFGVGMAAFLGVAVLGVLPGIAIAVGLSVLNVFRRTWWPYHTELGKPEDVDGYHDLTVYPQAERLTGLVLFRFDAPLIFANARTFRDEIRALTRTATPPRWVVVAAEPITDVDTTAADMLEDLDRELNAAGISLVFAEMKTPVEEKIVRYELTRTINPDHFYPTIEQAVAAYRELGERTE